MDPDPDRVLGFRHATQPMGNAPPGPTGTVTGARGLPADRARTRLVTNRPGCRSGELVDGVTDTTLITTGLDLWSSSDPTTILPRGPKPVAQEVSGQVLQSHTNPVLAPLTRHPSSALRRRIWWALVTTALITGALSWMVLTDVIGGAVLWTAAALLPLALAGAVIAYRALGHTIAGDYLVVRSGLLSRSTTALQRTAVSTIAVSESLLQRRLGLRSVSAMTAAGYGAYDAPDVPALHAFEFANDASAGLLEPFLEPIDQGAGKKAG